MDPIKYNTIQNTPSTRQPPTLNTTLPTRQAVNSSMTRLPPELSQPPPRPPPPPPPQAHQQQQPQQQRQPHQQQPYQQQPLHLRQRAAAQHTQSVRVPGDGHPSPLPLDKVTAEERLTQDHKFASTNPTAMNKEITETNLINIPNMSDSNPSASTKRKIASGPGKDGINPSYPSARKKGHLDVDSSTNELVSIKPRTTIESLRADNLRLSTEVQTQNTLIGELSDTIIRLTQELFEVQDTLSQKLGEKDARIDTLQTTLSDYITNDVVPKRKYNKLKVYIILQQQAKQQLQQQLQQLQQLPQQQQQQQHKSPQS